MTKANVLVASLANKDHPCTQSELLSTIEKTLITQQSKKTVLISLPDPSMEL